VIALSSGDNPRVAEIDEEFLGRRYWVYATDLVPLPMKYHGNEVPR